MKINEKQSESELQKIIDQRISELCEMGFSRNLKGDKIAYIVHDTLILIETPIKEIELMPFDDFEAFKQNSQFEISNFMEC